MGGFSIQRSVFEAFLTSVDEHPNTPFLRYVEVGSSEASWTYAEVAARIAELQMPAILLPLPASDNEFFASQVRLGFGAGVDPRHHERFERRFGFPLLEAWAMTETGGGAAVVANREPRHVGQRCFGRPPSEIEYRLVKRGS